MKSRFLASHSTLSSPLLRFGLVRKDVYTPDVDLIVTRATPMMIIMIAAAARARRVRAYTVHTARAVLVRNARGAADAGRDGAPGLQGFV
jgi:hypothetical protein